MHPTKIEEVSLNNMRFSLSDLTFNPVQVFRVTAENPEIYFNQASYGFKQYESTDVIVPYLDGDKCYVQYEYEPNALVNEQPGYSDQGEKSIPSLLVGDDKQAFLCYYASALHYKTLNQGQKAALWETTFEDAIRSIPTVPVPTQSRKFRNLY